MRRLALAAGLAVLALLWLGPLLGPWRQSLLAGMVAHMGVIALAAPLIAIGLPWRLGQAMPASLPLLASGLELAIVWGWHAPLMREAATAVPVVLAAEQGSFLAAGLLLWSTSLATTGRHAAIGAGALLFTSIHMTLLGALLTLSPRPLYGSQDVTCFGLVLDARQDQQLGGVLMLLAGSVAYLTGGLILGRRLLAPEPHPAALTRQEAPARPGTPGIRP
jgi:putative membrane protein